MYGIFCAESQTLFQVSSPDMGSEFLRLICSWLELFLEFSINSPKQRYIDDLRKYKKIGLEYCGKTKF